MSNTSLPSLHSLIYSTLTRPTNQSQAELQSFLLQTPNAVSLLIQYLCTLMRKDTNALDWTPPEYQNTSDSLIQLMVMVLIILRRFMEQNPLEYLKMKSNDERQQIRRFCVEFVSSSQNEWHKVTRLLRSVANLLVTWIRVEGGGEQAALEKQQQQKSSSRNGSIRGGAQSQRTEAVIQATPAHEQLIYSTLESLQKSKCPDQQLLHILSHITIAFSVNNFQPLLQAPLVIIKKYQNQLDQEKSRHNVCLCLRVLRQLSDNGHCSTSVTDLLTVLMNSSLTNELQIEGYKLFESIAKTSPQLFQQKFNQHLQSILASVVREAERFEKNSVWESHESQVYNLFGESIDTETMCMELVSLVITLVSRDFFSSLMEQEGADAIQQFLQKLFYHLVKLMQITKENMNTLKTDPMFYLEDTLTEYNLRDACMELLQEFLDIHGCDEEDTKLEDAFLSAIQRHLNECQQGNNPRNYVRQEATLLALGHVLSADQYVFSESKQKMQFLSRVLDYVGSQLGKNIGQSTALNEQFLSSRHLWFLSVVLSNFSQAFPQQLTESFWKYSVQLLANGPALNEVITITVVHSICVMLLRQVQHQGGLQKITSITDQSALDSIISTTWALASKKSDQRTGALNEDVARVCLEPLAQLVRYFPSSSPPSIMANDERARTVYSKLFRLFLRCSNDGEVTECMMQLGEQGMNRENAANPLLELMLGHFQKVCNPQESNGAAPYIQPSFFELFSSLLFQCSSQHKIRSLSADLISSLINFANSQLDDDRMIEAIIECIRILVVRFSADIDASANNQSRVLEPLVGLVLQQLKLQSGVAQTFAFGNLAYDLICIHLSKDSNKQNAILSQLCANVRDLINGNVQVVNGAVHNLWSQSLVVLMSRLYLIFGARVFQGVDMSKYCSVWLRVMSQMHPCAESYKQACIQALHRYVGEIPKGKLSSTTILHPQFNASMCISESELVRISLGEACKKTFSMFLESYEKLKKEQQLVEEKDFFADWVFRKYCIDEDDTSTVFEDPIRCLPEVAQRDPLKVKSLGEFYQLLQKIMQ